MKTLLFYLFLGVLPVLSNALPNPIEAVPDSLLNAPLEPPELKFVGARQENATFGPHRESRYTQVTAYIDNYNCNGGRSYTWTMYLDQKEGCYTFVDSGRRSWMYSLLYTGEFSSYAMYTNENCGGGRPVNHNARWRGCAPQPSGFLSFYICPGGCGGEGGDPGRPPIGK